MTNIKVKEISNNTNHEFNDLLGREKLAENFLKVILTQNAKVYSINAPWGAGKTYFLKFIENSCKNHKVPFIQYNIWETDYLDNPLKSILNEFLNLILTLECDKYITKEIKELAKQTKICTSQFIEFIKRFGFHFDYVLPSQDGLGSYQMGISKAPTVVVTDNDGDIENLKEKYRDYLNEENIKICFSADASLKTLEPNMYAANGYDKLKVLFARPANDTEEQFKKFFISKNNKTNVALTIFDTKKGAVDFPQYIKDAIKK